LCASISAVSAVVIVRIPVLPQLDPAKKGLRKPGKITITSPAKARTLARAVCGLPRRPTGVFHCPAYFGGGYELIFIAAGRRLPVVVAETSGCELVSGIGTGPVRWAATTPRFWRVLGRVAGIRALAH
jgi:hypothetical protein